MAGKGIASSREIRGEAGKSMLTHHTVTFTECRDPAGERERKGKRKTDRKSSQAASTLRYY